MKRRIVFAGDSIVHGGPWQYWQPEHYVTNFAFPGHTTSDMDVLVDDIVASQPELLIVMIGTNDFGKHRLPEDEVIRNILNVAKLTASSATLVCTYNEPAAKFAPPPLLSIAYNADELRSNAIILYHNFSLQKFNV